MSAKHPIIAITGSSGAGTTTVKTTFQQIFRREGIAAAIIEGDAFHRLRPQRDARENGRGAEAGEPEFSHFGPDTNLLRGTRSLFRDLRRNAAPGKRRKYLHDEARGRGLQAGARHLHAVGRPPIRHRHAVLRRAAWRGRDREGRRRRHAELLIGVVPIINLEWIQKLHRDKNARG